MNRLRYTTSVPTASNFDDHEGTPIIIDTSDDGRAYYLDDTDVVREIGDRLTTARVTTLIVDKSATSGIKIDTASASYPWHDLKGPISVRGTGGTIPSFNAFVGGCREFQFAVSDEVFLLLHLPHDYALGTDLHLHFHWGQNATTKAGAASGTVTGGTVTWGAEVSYAKGHQQAAFSSTITTTVAQNCNTTSRWHHIAEVQLSAVSPSASQLDTDIIEPDGLLTIRGYLSANGITVASGSTPSPFLLEIDIHYQSTNIGTKQKSPDFYS
jgi:hypothetical protein